MALHAWRYDDPRDTNTSTNHYIFPRNPEKATSPVLDRNISAVGTLGGGFATWEGVKTAKQWTFTGKILSKAHYEAMLAWHQRGNRFTVTDHFGRVITVAPLSFDPEPKTIATNYWNHDYTVTVLVLDCTLGSVGDIWPSP